MIKLSNKGFTPLEMDSCSRIDYGNASEEIVQERRFLSLTGFTLLELLTAAAILVVVISGLLLTFVYCTVLNESNNNLVKATNDAQYVLEQIKGLPYEEISSYTPPVFGNLENESVTVSRTIGSTISEITVNVSWNERNGQKNFLLSTRIAK